jgi:hypothetical protein
MEGLGVIGQALLLPPALAGLVRKASSLERLVTAWSNWSLTDKPERTALRTVIDDAHTEANRKSLDRSFNGPARVVWRDH